MRHFSYFSCPLCITSYLQHALTVLNNSEYKHTNGSTTSSFRRHQCTINNVLQHTLGITTIKFIGNFCHDSKSIRANKPMKPPLPCAINDPWIDNALSLDRFYTKFETSLILTNYFIQSTDKLDGHFPKCFYPICPLVKVR